MATTIRNEDRMPGAKRVSEVKYHGSTALYGRSGSGKTTLAGTFPKPILYINVRDNGTDSISDVEDIDVVDVNSSDDLKKIILWLAGKANKGKLKYKTVVLDTMTQLQGIFVSELGEKKGLGKSGKKKAGDFGSLTKQDWGVIAGDMKSVVMDIRNLPVESVFIAQEKVFNAGEGDDDGADQIEPDVGCRLMPSVRKDLEASVSTIGNTFIRIQIHKEKVDGKSVKRVEKQYCMRVGPNPVYTTKVRKPKGIAAPDFIVDPTFRKIKAIMKGKE